MYWIAGRIAGSVSPRKYQIETETNEATASVSSTILLAAGDGIVTQVGGPAPPVGRRTRSNAAARQAASEDEAKRTWGLAANAEATALLGRFENQRE